MTQSLKAFLCRSLAVAGCVTAASMVVFSALAGECPAGAMKPNAREQVNFQPVGVADTTLGSIDLCSQVLSGRDRRVCDMAEATMFPKRETALAFSPAPRN
jgi:hypothetical protein